ncbi:peroxiredoxin [Beijerinckia sp. L45]|uniref:peroxiredoxin n=1 Tax=Beijerinckia sp. L45 TaxID=1641855 RepID=UPI00131C0F41|nr:peroxiredoxin [Beijerinckia sp. L45]
MTIKVGDTLPEATFFVMTEDGPAPRKSDAIFANRKVVLVGVPGAFTPTCSMNHLPGFLDKETEIKAKGVDEILVTAVNDVFVMGAWDKSTGGQGKVTFLADGSAKFAEATGLTVDLGERGLGTRSIRYSMIVDNGVVTTLNVDANPGKAEASSAETLLTQL